MKQFETFEMIKRFKSKFAKAFQIIINETKFYGTPFGEESSPKIKKKDCLKTFDSGLFWRKEGLYNQRASLCLQVSFSDTKWPDNLPMMVHFNSLKIFPIEITFNGTLAFRITEAGCCWRHRMRDKILLIRSLGGTFQRNKINIADNATLRVNKASQINSEDYLEACKTQIMVN